MDRSPSWGGISDALCLRLRFLMTDTTTTSKLQSLTVLKIDLTAVVSGIFWVECRFLCKQHGT